MFGGLRLRVRPQIPLILGVAAVKIGEICQRPRHMSSTDACKFYGSMERRSLREGPMLSVKTRVGKCTPYLRFGLKEDRTEYASSKAPWGPHKYTGLLVMTNNT